MSVGSSKWLKKRAKKARREARKVFNAMQVRPEPHERTEWSPPFRGFKDIGPDAARVADEHQWSRQMASDKARLAVKRSK